MKRIAVNFIYTLNKYLQLIAMYHAFITRKTFKIVISSTISIRYIKIHFACLGNNMPT